MASTVQVVTGLLAIVTLTAGIAASDEALTSAIQKGDATKVQQLLSSHPELPGADCRSLGRLAIAGTNRTLLEMILRYAAERKQLTGCRGLLDDAIGSKDAALVKVVVNSMLRIRPVTISTENPRLLELHEAARRGQSDVVRMFVKLGANVNERDSKGDSLLHEASLNGRIIVVAALLELGADVRAANLRGSTPLHEGALGGNGAVLGALLNGGALVNARDQDGATPLIYAAAFGRRDAVEFLLKAGADATLRAHDGKDARLAAEAVADKDIVELLEAHSRRMPKQ